MENSQRTRIRAGDTAAFAALFDTHGQAVHRYAAHSTGDWSTAEDVVSLTFLEAWRLRTSLHEDGGPLLPWLFGIATNVLRNTARSARRHRAAMERVPPREVVPDFADELVDRMHDAARLAAAQRALAALRRPEREVFALVVWSGLDYASAAEALGVPVGTVRSRLSRARTRLQALAAKELELAPESGQYLAGRDEPSQSYQKGINR